MEAENPPQKNSSVLPEGNVLESIDPCGHVLLLLMIRILGLLRNGVVMVMVMLADAARRSRRVSW